MSDELNEERRYVHGQLDEAVEELRRGSIIVGVEMVETTRDELAKRLGEWDDDEDEEGNEE